MATLHTVKQAAELLSVSTATVRRIADEFAEHLPDYQPRPGQARKFTDGDLRTIYAIQSRLLDNPGQTRAALLAELSEPDTEPLVIPATLPADIPENAQNARRAAKTQAGTQTDAESPGSAIQPFLQAHADTQRQLDAISDRMEQLSERESQPAPARSAEMAALVSVGVLVSGILASAVLQWQVAGLVSAGLALMILIVGLVAPSMRR